MTKPPRFKLLKNRHRRRNRVPIEIESDGSVEISPVDASSRSRQAAKNFHSRQTESIARSHRNNSELGFGRSNEFGCGCVRAAVMADLDQIRARMMERSHTALDLLLRISLQQNRR